MEDFPSSSPGFHIARRSEQKILPPPPPTSSHPAPLCVELGSSRDALGGGGPLWRRLGKRSRDSGGPLTAGGRHCRSMRLWRESAPPGLAGRRVADAPDWPAPIGGGASIASTGRPDKGSRLETGWEAEQLETEVWGTGKAAEHEERAAE